MALATAAGYDSKTTLFPNGTEGEDKPIIMSFLLKCSSIAAPASVMAKTFWYLSFRGGLPPVASSVRRLFQNRLSRHALKLARSTSLALAWAVGKDNFKLSLTYFTQEDRLQ